MIHDLLQLYLGSAATYPDITVADTQYFCDLLIGWSTSSNLFKDEKQVKGTGGIRFYIPVDDASKIPKILDIMHKRSWLHGQGWAFVDGAGKFQERSLVDRALGRPAQPDYAAPELKDGLTQNREWRLI